MWLTHPHYLPPTPLPSAPQSHTGATVRATTPTQSLNMCMQWLAWRDGRGSTPHKLTPSPEGVKVTTCGGPRASMYWGTRCSGWKGKALHSYTGGKG